MPINKHLAEFLFGEQPSEALKKNTCVMCKKNITGFRDEVSKKEYEISALCQACQDSIFEDESEELWKS